MSVSTSKRPADKSGSTTFLPDGSFRHLLQNLPAGAYTCDADGLITYCNDLAVEMWGREPKLMEENDRWCGSFKLFTTDGTPIAHSDCWMARAIKNRKGYNGCEIVVERPDGVRWTALAHANPIFNEAGELVGAVNVLVDISNQKRLEQNLVEHKSEMDELFNNAAIGIHWVGPDGTILKVNPAELQMLGYEEDEYVGRNIAEFHVSQDAIQDILKRLTADETLQDYEARLRCKDGSIKTVLITSSVYWKHGEFMHTNCFTVDITERRRGQAAAAMLASIVESSGDAILSQSLDGTVQSWNKGAERLFGYLEDEAVGKHFMHLIPPDRHEEEREVFEQLRNGKLTHHYETERTTKDGKRFSVSITISALRDSSGNVTGVSKIVRDISKQKRSEDLLRESDKRKDEFLAVLAHELRNPLAPIRNASEILTLSNPENEHAKWALSVIDRQVHQMTHLIDDLMDIARITGDKLELNKEKIDLADAVHTAIETTRPLIEEHGHNFTVTVPDQPLYLIGDHVRLAQVISNILNNAAKYTDQGGHIWLNVDKIGNEAIIKVRDTGVGIEPDKLAGVFDMFSQGEYPGNTKGGLGIGLTLVKKLTEMHNGSVAMESGGKGLGCTCVLRLPTLETSSSTARTPVSQKPDITLRKELNVLIVDDNKDATQSMEMLLKGLRCKVRVGYDGLEALQLASEFKPDVMLLDIGMPKLNGFEVAQKIRSQAWGRKMVLIATTGWGQESDRERSKESGFDYHLVKPMNIQQLFGILETIARDN